MEARISEYEARRFGTMALIVFFIQAIVIPIIYSIVFPIIFSSNLHLPLYFIFLAIFFFFFIPFFLVDKVEKRDRKSLGLVLSQDKYLSYLLYVVVGLVILAVLSVSYSYFNSLYTPETNTKIESKPESINLYILFQSAATAFCLEFYFRGYLMTRFCDWLGETKGLLLNACIYTLDAIIYEIVNHIRFDVSSGLFTHKSLLLWIFLFIAGLIYGYQYQKTKSIITPAITSICFSILDFSILRYLF